MTKTIDKQNLDEFERLLEESFAKSFNVADIVVGTVMKKENDGYLISVKGAKTEAFLPNREVANSADKDVDEVVKLWDEKEFYIVKDEEDDEVAILSLKKVSCAQAWQKLTDIKTSNETALAKVLSSVKGGLIAEIEGLK